MRAKTLVLTAIVIAIAIFGISSITLADDTTYYGASLARNWTGICDGGVTEVTNTNTTATTFKLQPILAGIPIPAGNVRCYAAYIQGDTLYLAQRVGGMLVFMPYNPEVPSIPYYDVSYFDGNSWTPTAFDAYMPNGTSVSGKTFIFGIAPIDTYTISDFVEKFYGDWVIFKAAAVNPDDPNTIVNTVPVIMIDEGTSGIIATTSNTATIFSAVVDKGGSDIIAQGVCYDTKLYYDPYVTDHVGYPGLDGHGTCTSGGSIVNGRFTITLTGLGSNTRYYARAYATNSAGTNYSQDVEFATQVAAPGTSTTAFRATINTVVVAQNVAYVNYTVTADGSDLPVLSRGVCFGTAANPATICTPDATGGTGTFTAVNTAAVNSSSGATGFSLTAGATYHARAYAVNSNGIVYSSDYTFTVAAAGPPVVGNVFASRAGAIATVASTIITDGGSPITSRGVCYSTTDISNATTYSGTVLAPAIAAPNTAVTVGAATVYCTSDTSYTSTLGGGGLTFNTTLPGTNPALTAGTTYYVVTYAVNSANSGTPARSPSPAASFQLERKTCPCGITISQGLFQFGSLETRISTLKKPQTS